MNFYNLNQIIEQSKVSEQADIRRATKPAVKPVTPAVKPVTPAVKPAVAGAKPAVAGAKPAVAGAKPAVAGAKPAPRRAKIKPPSIPPTCPSFGCKEPEASPQKIVKDIKDLSPDKKQKVNKFVQDIATAK
jgi:hypothetical protein